MRCGLVGEGMLLRLALGAADIKVSVTAPASCMSSCCHDHNHNETVSKSSNKMLSFIKVTLVTMSFHNSSTLRYKLAPGV